MGMLAEGEIGGVPASTPGARANGNRAQTARRESGPGSARLRLTFIAQVALGLAMAQLEASGVSNAWCGLAMSPEQGTPTGPERRLKGTIARLRAGARRASQQQQEEEEDFAPMPTHDVVEGA